MFIDNILLITLSFRYHESLRASLFDLCIHHEGHEAHEVYFLFFVFSVCFVGDNFFCSETSRNIFVRWNGRAYLHRTGRASGLVRS